MSDSMTVRERFQAVMNFKPFDRLPVIEWAGWWDKTLDRWHIEGLPEQLTDADEIKRYFGQDIYKQDWLVTIAEELPQLEGEDQSGPWTIIYPSATGCFTHMFLMTNGIPGQRNR